MIIMIPNSYEKLTKNNIRQSWRRFKTLLKINHLAYRKSYMVTMFTHSHEKLTKIEIMSSWSQFKHCAESLISTKEVISGHYLPKSQEQITKSEIRTS